MSNEFKRWLDNEIATNKNEQMVFILERVREKHVGVDQAIDVLAEELGRYKSTSRNIRNSLTKAIELLNPKCEHNFWHKKCAKCFISEDEFTE